MQARSLRDNVLAGGFVVAGLAAGVWGSFLLGDRPTGSGLAFVVRFSLNEGATGLKEGSPVLLGGKQIGQVKTVAFQIGAGGAPEGVDVGVEVDKSITLYENAGVFLDRPLLGTLSSINIASAGSADVSGFRGKPAIETGDVVDGAIAPPAMLASAGYGPEQSKAVGDMILSLRDSAAEINRIIKEAGPNATKGVEDAKAVLASVRDRIDGWRTEVDTVLKNIQEASASINTASAKLPDTVEEARAVVKKGSDIADRAIAVIDENRQGIKETIESVRSSAAKLDQKVVDKVLATLGEVDEALDVFSVAVKNVDQILQDGRFDLKNTLANMSLASQEMKLTMSEVRAAPWRVFYKPSLKERETEDLYGAATAFAEAAAQVRSAAETLAAAGGTQVPSPNFAEHMKELQKVLDDSIANYRAAGTKLMDELVERK